jgi:hypothetical protein
VQVHCDEGAAIHIGPEPCIASREGRGEASAGERVGQPLSRERKLIPRADAVRKAEGNTDGHVTASARAPRRGLRPWHVRKLFAGNREVPRLAGVVAPRRSASGR